ncbi:hypothetical protein WJX77_004367 [Trebouxia sp. C0004]
MQPAHQDQQSDPSQEAEAARKKTALSDTSFQRERKSPIREATPSRSAREDVRRPSSPRRSGARRSYSPSEHRREHRRVSEGQQPAQGNSHSQDTRPPRQPSSRYSREGSPRPDHDRRSRDQSSQPRPSAGESRHRLSQANDRQDQPSARHHPPRETSAADTSISPAIPATQQSQGQPAPDPFAQQHQVRQESHPVQQPASFHSGPQNIKQVANGVVPRSQAAPAMPAAPHSPSTATLPLSPSRPPQPPAGLLSVTLGANPTNQEACSPFHDPSQGLSTVTSMPSGGSATHPTAASLSPPLSLPGPPARQLDPPSLHTPAPRQPSTSGQEPPSTSLPSRAQAPITSKDPALDFFSEGFDALRALYTRGLLPPVPRVKVLDNVVKCRLILPPELPESWSAWNAAHPKAEASEESIKHKELAKHRTTAVLKREQDWAAKGNTLDKITEKFKEGPLLLLRRYYKTSVRLQVVTRHASGIRGTATGYLHGFDKFMNLVLMNVDEDYTVMTHVPHPYTVMVHEPADPQPPPMSVSHPMAGEQEQQLVMVQKQVNKFRWKRKAEKRKRRLHQVFLRGDNIVTVTPVLRDVERGWTQLLYQWRAVGFPEAALVTPASLAAAADALPPPPSLPLPFPSQR